MSIVWFGDGRSDRITTAHATSRPNIQEDLGTEACSVGKAVEPDEMGWTHGQNEKQTTSEES